MLPEERAQYRRRRSERRRSEGSNMSSSPQSDPSTEWAHQQMARLRSRVEAQRRDAAAEAGSPTGDRLSKLLDRALQGPATPASPREAPEQLRTEAATLRAALEREKDAAEELRRTLAHEAEASDGVRRQLKTERDAHARTRETADASRDEARRAKDANAVLRSELAAAHCELQRAADDLSRMADAAPTVVNGDHDAAVEALCGALRAAARREVDAVVQRERRSADAALANAKDLAAADLAMALAERDVAHGEAMRTNQSRSPDGSEVERLTKERDEARKERDAFRDALGEASAQAQGLKQEQDKSLRVAAKRADETKKEGAEAQRALVQERRDRRDADAERETALRVARTAWLATRQRLLAVVVSERARADRNKKRYKACEADLDKAHERSRRLRAEVDALKRLPPRPPPTPSPGRPAPTPPAAARPPPTPPPSAPCPHTGLTPDVAHKDVDDVFADAAEAVLSSRASSTRATPTGSRDYDVDDIFHERLGAVSEALASSPPLVAGRKKYRG